jgi:hypothetical protein
MSTLERTTHICLIAACIVSIGLLLERRFAPAAGSQRPSATQLLGHRLTVAGLDWKSSGLNAVLFISTHCHFCLESMPFYRQVTAVQVDSLHSVAITIISRDPPELVKDTLSREHIRVRGVYPVPSMIPLYGTPTLLIVDATGVVRRVFEGKLNAAGEKEFLEIVKAGVLKKT